MLTTQSHESESSETLHVVVSKHQAIKVYGGHVGKASRIRDYGTNFEAYVT
jgi:hypothetical protein